jgi:hypothetical protein
VNQMGWGVPVGIADREFRPVDPLRWSVGRAGP